jgi:hypothetical protein
VARPSKWDNPFKVGCLVFADGVALLAIRDRRHAVELYRHWIVGQESLLESLIDLRGRDLACRCPLDQPCHADVLLELANR